MAKFFYKFDTEEAEVKRLLVVLLLSVLLVLACLPKEIRAQNEPVLPVTDRQQVQAVATPTATKMMPVPVKATEKPSLPVPSSSILVKIVDAGHPVTEAYVSGVKAHSVNIDEFCRKLFGKPVLVWNTTAMAHEIAINDLCRLLKASYDQGSRLTLRSGLRTFEEQKSALSKTDTPGRVMPAGQSQHHTGLAFDFTAPGVSYQLVKEFRDTPEYKFLADFGWKYGFVESYVANHDGVISEPWHWVYLGPELAQKYLELKAQGLVKDPFEFQALYQQ